MTVGKRDGGFEAPVGRLGAEVGGRPQTVGSSGGCRRQYARCGLTREWLGARSAVRGVRETSPHVCTRCRDRGKDGWASFKGASSRCRCVTADADGKRGIAKNTIQRLSTQQGELLQAVALTPMRHDHRKGTNQPFNDDCWYCHGRGHFKRDCVALNRTRRNTAELASIARRHRGRRRGDTTLTRRAVVADDTDSARSKQRQSFRESSSEARQQTFAKQRAMLLAEHATAMLARDSELETLEEKCRCLTQQLKAALHTHVL